LNDVGARVHEDEPLEWRVSHGRAVDGYFAALGVHADAERRHVFTRSLEPFFHVLTGSRVPRFWKIAKTVSKVLRGISVLREVQFDLAETCCMPVVRGEIPCGAQRGVCFGVSFGLERRSALSKEPISALDDRSRAGNGFCPEGPTDSEHGEQEGEGPASHYFIHAFGGSALNHTDGADAIRRDAPCGTLSAEPVGAGAGGSEPGDAPVAGTECGVVRPKAALTGTAGVTVKGARWVAAR
jgi:hypothetical protein